MEKNNLIRKSFINNIYFIVSSINNCNYQLVSLYLPIQNRETEMAGVIFIQTVLFQKNII